ANNRRSRKHQRQRGRYRWKPDHFPEDKINLMVDESKNTESGVIIPPQDRLIEPNHFDTVVEDKEVSLATENLVSESPQIATELKNEVTTSSESSGVTSDVRETPSNCTEKMIISDNIETETDSYTFKGYECVYDVYNGESTQTPLLLIHPIGVGLSRQFWERFCTQWYGIGQTNPIYNPDLLGCGESDAPHVAYYAEDWAAQLEKLVTTVIKKPVIIVVQGALFPVAVELIKIASDSVKAIVASGPPAWELITTKAATSQQKILWNLLFDTAWGSAFYRYARRRQFLESFSVRQLFATEAAVDEEWLETLELGAADLKTRHAVFSFLAGFWRKDYGDAIAQIQQPALMLFGEGASSISRQGASETPQERLNAYIEHLPQGEGKLIPGRNVMPYEAPAAFVAETAEFVRKLTV
ncbi:MAG: alpha/beta hydrolase, partial [Jaaginema sp. PMC 1079.18]|nr:alpha/beta hydrolase [Jaaginema sp. PMC 1079.18]